MMLQSGSFRARAALVCLVLITLPAACFTLPMDLRALVNAQLNAGKKRIVIWPGRYYVRPERGVCLSFKGLTNVQITATGVEMICAETSRAVSFEDCRNVRLTGLAIDYDPLPFTEARITAMAPDRSWAEVEDFAGYPGFG